MKKIVISVFLILVFGAYVFRQKAESNQVNVISENKNQKSYSQNVEKSNSLNLSPTVLPLINNSSSTGMYKDGIYTGDITDAYYGPYQVKTVINGGKIADIIFLQYPNDRSTSIEINSQAMPYLKQEAIQAQSENVDIVSGATDSSRAFIQSLSSALAKAKN